MLRTGSIWRREWPSLFLIRKEDSCSSSSFFSSQRKMSPFLFLLLFFFLESKEVSYPRCFSSSRKRIPVLLLLFFFFCSSSERKRFPLFLHLFFFLKKKKIPKATSRHDHLINCSNKLPNKCSWMVLKLIAGPVQEDAAPSHDALLHDRI